MKLLKTSTTLGGPVPSAKRVRIPSLMLAALLAGGACSAQADDFSLADGTYGGALRSVDPWSLVPVSGARLEGQARLDTNQEIKLSTQPTGWFGAYGGADLGGGAPRFDGSSGLDQPRATYRYTWLSMHDVDLKVGLTSNLATLAASLRSGISSPSLRFGTLPQMHLSGVGRLAGNWQVALDADGLWTARGRSLDLDLHIDYSLSPSMQFYGGYRMTDYAGDAEDFYGFTTLNSANVGLRFRF